MLVISPLFIFLVHLPLSPSSSSISILPLAHQEDNELSNQVADEDKPAE
jgi:hypothetical protein